MHEAMQILRENPRHQLNWTSTKSYDCGDTGHLLKAYSLELHGMKHQDASMIGFKLKHSHSMKLKLLSQTLTKYVSDTKTYVLMKNLILVKECNYVECRAKDVKVFCLCRRCKSAFYCCRNHQKKDWKKHKSVCRESENRLYRY